MFLTGPLTHCQNMRVMQTTTNHTGVVVVHRTTTPRPWRNSQPKPLTPKVKPNQTLPEKCISTHFFLKMRSKDIKHCHYDVPRMISICAL